MGLQEGLLPPAGTMVLIRRNFASLELEMSDHARATQQIRAMCCSEVEVQEPLHVQR